MVNSRVHFLYQFCHLLLQEWQMDSSNDEWEEHITHQYSEGRECMLHHALAKVDNNLDIARIVERTFYGYDVLTTTIALNRSSIHASN